MFRRPTILRSFLLTSLLLIGGRLSALELQPAQPASWTLYVENDSFLETDRYYTNGIRLTRTYSRDGLPRWAEKTFWLERALDGVPLCPAGSSDANCFNFESAWTFGQNLYTPLNLRTSRLIRDQRPYGAWLYYGNVLNLIKPDLQHGLEIDVGMVGPSALGEPVQRGWHSFLRSLGDSDNPPDPKGWRHQVKNQPGLQLLYQGKMRLLEGKKKSEVRYFDLVPQVNAAVGTVYVNASVGATVRVGYNVPQDFPDVTPPPAPPPPLPLAAGGFALAAHKTAGLPGSSANSLHAQAGPEQILVHRPRSKQVWEAYLFGRADYRYVAYSVFLDGNLSIFGRSHSVPKEPFVTDLQVGAVLGRRHWRIAATLVDRSQEFQAQQDHQRYLSLSLFHRR